MVNLTLRFYIDEMDRKRRSILTPYLPRYGNSPFMQMEDDSEDDNEGEGM